MGKKDGMYLYNDWLAPFEKLEKAEVGELIIAMMKYSISGEEPPKYDGLLAMAADFIFPQIDRSKEYARLGSRGGIATSKKVYGKSEKENEIKKVRENSSLQPVPDRCDCEAPLQNGETDSSADCIITEESQREDGDKKETPLPENNEKDAFADGGLYERQLFENRFNKFWRNYPRKVERQRAYNVFQKIKPDDTLVRKMLNAIEVQKKTTRWKKDDGQFIPYPANWLEGRRWEDEVEAASDELNDLLKNKKKEKQENKSSSFDTDEFFDAALKRADNFLNGV